MSHRLEGIQRRATETVTGLRAELEVLRVKIAAFDRRENGADNVLYWIKIGMFTGNGEQTENIARVS